MKFRWRDKKVALAIDDCPGNPRIENLKAIELVFLPPNIMSKTQPMDLRVI